MTSSTTTPKKPGTVKEWQDYLRLWVLRTGVCEVRRQLGGLVKTRRSIYKWIGDAPSMPDAATREKLDELMGLDQPGAA